MLIVKKTNDYYDGVAGSMGVDKTIVFERHMFIIEEKDKRFPEEFEKGSWDELNPFHDINYLDFDFDENKILLTPFIIFFCGKSYIGWRQYIKKDSYSFDTNYVYDSNYIKKHNVYKGWRMSIDEIYKKIENYNPIDIHREFNSPILLLDLDHERVSFKKYRQYHKLIVNPTLKDYEFYKIFDSFLAFQEIQMYISGVLGNNEKDIIEVDDKHKIDQHGFDNWSFRKEPGSKKRRKNK
ncbi:MAG: hypothetical protein ACOC33_03855 [bacterium]